MVPSKYLFYIFFNIEMFGLATCLFLSHLPNVTGVPNSATLFLEFWKVSFFQVLHVLQVQGTSVRTVEVGFLPLGQEVVGLPFR